MSDTRLLLLATACALVLSVQCGVPITHQIDVHDASDSVSAEHSTASPDDTSACWLYRFRTLTWEDIKKEGINWKDSFEHHWGITVFFLAVLACGVILMLFGWWFGRFALLLVGILIGTSFTFFAINSVFNAIHWSNCIVLGVGTAVGAIIAAAVFLRVLSLGLFCLGAAVGFAIGYAFYGIVLVEFKTTVILGYDAILWVIVIFLGSLAGYVAVREETMFMIIGTSVLGAYVSGVAVDELFFGGGHFNLSNAQMQCVLHPAQRPKNCPPGMDVWSTDFYILCFSTMAVALLAICVQRLLSANYADSEPDVYVQPQARRYYAV